MANVKDLEEAIEQYQVQLSQIDMTLSVTSDGPDRDNLLSLKADIEELISLTNESVQSLAENSAECKGEDENPNDETDDPLDKEYALFKVELNESLDNNETMKPCSTTTVASSSIEDELKELEGMKCKILYSYTHEDDNSYRNAMVCSICKNNDGEIKDIHDIKVQVFFLNPMYKGMVPCRYFLDGHCKFSDKHCHYSHGEIVPVSSLREYKEPDFHNIKVNSKVLAKGKDNIWRRAFVLKLPQKDGDEYKVILEDDRSIMEIELQDLLPLDNMDLSSDDTDSESNSVHMTLQPHETFGTWEKHTRGMGSKLMMQMGYVIGTSLGKHGDGRVQPVEITVSPAGKSLDYCMELREYADGNKDLFAIERKMREQEQELEQQRERQYQREKEGTADGSAFNFSNQTLDDKQHQLVHKSLSTLQSQEHLGDWEKHTRGIGSKLMMQMGYVIGTGLGKRGDGRVQPVEATVLPARKSLDYCMDLREFADGNKDLFAAERKMRKQKQKLERQRERQYQREKKRADSNVFSFLNKALGYKPIDDNAASSSQSKDQLRTGSNRDLNVANFQIGENINRLERESLKLKESLAKHLKGSTLYNNLMVKYNENQKELNNLRASERNIVAEQNQRKNKAKLTVF